MSNPPRAAIVGYGDVCAEFDDPQPALPLAARAVKRAVEDAGLRKDQIDGLLTGRRPASDYRPQWNNVLSSYLNLTPEFTTSVNFHSAGTISMVEYASTAVRQGLVDFVVCAHADAAASLGAKSPMVKPFPNYTEFAGTMDVHPEFEHPYGAIMPGVFALFARRQMHERGHTLEDFARVSVICRDWGVDHPYATLGHKGPISVEEVLDSRVVASPLHLLMMMPLGPAGYGGAYVVTTVERAKQMTDNPIYVRGYGSCSTHEYVLPRLNVDFRGARGDVLETGTVQAAEKAFAMAGLRRNDIDLIEMMGSFSSNVVLQLENLGFCEKGEGGTFLEEGHLDPQGGSIAFNTDGGTLTGGQPGVALATPRVVEALRQLRGEPLGRAAEGVRYGLIQGTGGALTCHAVLILSNQEGSP